MLKNKFFLAGLIIVLLFVGFRFVSNMNHRVAVSYVLASKGDISSYISTPGNVSAKVANLGIAMGGRVEKILAKEGDRVLSGQILAILDSYPQAKSDYQSVAQLFSQGLASSQQLDNAKTLMESKRVVSPINGIVTQVSIDEGEIAPPSSPIVTVVDTAKMWIEIQIDENDIPNISLSQKVKVSSDAYPDVVFEGVISWINYRAELKKVGDIIRPDEEDKVFRAKVSLLNNAISKFKPGMSVDVDILTKEKKGTITIPRKSIFQDKTRETALYVIDGWNAKKVIIETGVKNTISVEALSGVIEGDKIIIDNLNNLTDGAKIKLKK